MNTFELKIWDDEGKRCTFYTVQWTDAKENETDKFFKKHSAIAKLERSVQELLKFLTMVIGDQDGAKKEYFKFEDYAQALPPPGEHKVGTLPTNYSNFPLRLYCLRINEYIVILFNGGEKTSGKAKEGKTSMAFAEANQFAKKINEALKDGTIYVTDNERELRYFDNGREIII